MTKKGKDVRNQEITETVVLNSRNLKTGDLQFTVDAYPLQEMEFEKLTGFSGGLKEWSRRLVFVTLWAIIIFISKLIDFFTKDSIDPPVFEMQNYEFYAIGIAVFISLILWIISCFYKNPKDKLITKIKLYFQS